MFLDKSGKDFENYCVEFVICSTGKYKMLIMYVHFKVNKFVMKYYVIGLLGKF